MYVTSNASWLNKVTSNASWLNKITCIQTKIQAVVHIERGLIIFRLHRPLFTSNAVFRLHRPLFTSNAVLCNNAAAAYSAANNPTGTPTARPLFTSNAVLTSPKAMP